MKSILFLLVVLVAFVAAAEAIKCYECEPWTKKCKDFDAKADGVKEVTCDKHMHACLKMTASLTNGTSLAVRGCADKGTYFGINPKNVTDYGAWYCDSDLCNGVSATGAGLVTLMALSAPLLFTIWQ